MILWMLAIVTGIDARERLVEQNDFGIRDQAAGDFQPPPLAAGKRQGQRLAQLDDVELFQQLLAAPVSRFAVETQQFHDAKQVLFDGEFAEDAGFLGEIAHAALAGAAVHGPVGDVRRR